LAPGPFRGRRRITWCCVTIFICTDLRQLASDILHHGAQSIGPQGYAFDDDDDDDDESHGAPVFLSVTVDSRQNLHNKTPNGELNVDSQ